MTKGFTHVAEVPVVHGDAAPGALGAEVRRAEDARALVQIGLQLGARPGVVAEGDDVGPGTEDEIRLLRRDADDVGVLPVDHGEGDVMFRFIVLEPLLQAVESGLAAHIADRQNPDAHPNTSVQMKT